MEAYIQEILLSISEAQPHSQATQRDTVLEEVSIALCPGWNFLLTLASLETRQVLEAESVPPKAPLESQGSVCFLIMRQQEAEGQFS